MKVVVDTNVFISDVFFGGKPQRVLEKIVDGEICGLCTAEILDEYREVVQRMIEKRKKGPTLSGFSTSTPTKLKFFHKLWKNCSLSLGAAASSLINARRAFSYFVRKIVKMQRVVLFLV